MNNKIVNVGYTDASTSYCSAISMCATTDEVQSIKDYIDEKLAEPEVRLDQRTALDTRFKHIDAIYYENGRKTGSKELMSNIKSVDVYNDNTVKIVFANGDVQTATAQNGDKFSFETGVMICLMKEMLGKEPSQILGKLIDYAAKIFNDAEKTREKTALEAAERLAVQQRNKERMDRRWAKKRAREKEARIQEMAEAIVRANGIMNIKNK